MLSRAHVGSISANFNPHRHRVGGDATPTPMSFSEMALEELAGLVKILHS